MSAETFGEYAVTALLEPERGIGAADAPRESPLGRLRIGAYPGLCSSYLPAVIKQLSAAHPGLVVELAEADAARLARMVAEGSVDLALRPLLPSPPESARRQPAVWCRRVLWREEVVAVLSADDPLAADQGPLRLDDLLERTLIGTPAGAADEGGGFDLRAALGPATSRAEIAHLADQPRSLVALVRFGFGIGVIGRCALATVDTGGVVIRGIDSPTAFHDMAVFWTGRHAQNAGVEAFLDAHVRAPLPPTCRPPARTGQG